MTIKPSREKILAHLKTLKEVIRSHRSAPQGALIGKLNPIIRGWTNYYSTVVSKEVFSYCDFKLWEKLKQWSDRRHPNKPVHWIKRKYWKTVETAQRFAVSKDGTQSVLNRHADTPIKRFVKVQNLRSPYDGDWVYWSSRRGKDPQISKRIAILLKKQKGKCQHCQSYFNTEDLLEVDHIIPKSRGGKDIYDNIQLLHRHCHDDKTARDGSLDRCADVNGCLTEERDEVKVSRPVLKTSRGGDASA